MVAWGGRTRAFGEGSANPRLNFFMDATGDALQHGALSGDDIDDDPVTSAPL